MKDQKNDMMWAYLIHIGYSMWYEQDAGYGRLSNGYAEDYCTASDTLRFDRDVWDMLVDNMETAGINTLLIDLGEGVRFESHPEIAAKNALSIEDLRAELQKLRKKGITPVPKLNFSTSHDEWMGKYSRCVCSKEYYDVCRDLINEVSSVFGNPEYFHLGMDEETYELQRYNRYAVVRNGDQWWHDLYYLADLVEKNGVCPWVWSDRIWAHEEEYLRKMPKEILQSNWYYDGRFERERNYVRAYNVLDENGFRQVPTGSNWSCQWNFEGTVNYCNATCDENLIKGYMQTVWRPTVKEVKYRHLEAIDLVKKVRNDMAKK